MWSGWKWDGKKWRRRCEGKSIRDVTRKMRRLVRDVPADEQAIVAGGKAPEFVPKPREGS
jgi:hypothetical protein